MSRKEPAWLTRAEVEAIHALQLDQHGGLQGLRDEGALESALARPQHQWHYKVANDVAACGAAYGFAIAKNHAFSDGNKRTALVSMAVFIERNGFAFQPSEADAVTTMLAVATGEMDESALAAWLRRIVKKGKRRGRKRV